jgi:Na+/proline symporter
MPAFGRELNERSKLRWKRIMVLVIGATSIGIAISFANVYRLATISWAILLVGLFVPFALGMYWRSANGSGATAGFIGGFVSWLAGTLYFYPATKAANTIDGVLEIEDALWDAVYISCTPAVLVSLLLMIAVSLLTGRRNPPIPLTDADGKPLPLDRRLGTMMPRDLF